VLIQTLAEEGFSLHPHSFCAIASLLQDSVSGLQDLLSMLHILRNGRPDLIDQVQRLLPIQKDLVRKRDRCCAGKNVVQPVNEMQDVYGSLLCFTRWKSAGLLPD